MLKKSVILVIRFDGIRRRQDRQALLRFLFLLYFNFLYEQARA